MGFQDRPVNHFVPGTILDGHAEWVKQSQYEESFVRWTDEKPGH